MKRILSVFGTRPEAIKMAPLVIALSQDSRFESKICVTAQHREMLDQILRIFGIIPDYDLNVMKENQNLNNLTISILEKIEYIFEDFKPELILVHGDTSTTFSTALAAYFQKIPIGHIEAGLRTDNIFSPWPEEANRRLTSVLADFHFTPTELSKTKLLAENVPEEKITVTGNTVIDALFLAKKKLDSDTELKKELSKRFTMLKTNTKMILVTCHRRENFGGGINRICQALARIAAVHPKCEIIFPLHLNPNVKNPVEKELKNIKNIHLISPQNYLPFIFLMSRASIILTDSGGIQEEAPSLGKPVLLMRENTERQEAMMAGTVKLVGTNPDKIFQTVDQLLTDEFVYGEMSKAKNPYGDGSACSKIINILQKPNSNRELYEI